MSKGHLIENTARIPDTKQNIAVHQGRKVINTHISTELHLNFESCMAIELWQQIGKSDIVKDQTFTMQQLLFL